ncbi:hypothetical protein [Streptomyces fildesensis]|uniref:hypothetical protein n=1 Tax=Streptomyces fildesensis TaxID=375757 RepID=UPI0018DF221E|nr:hypothetical protein [Streptomyces fildesensis]
MFTFTALACVLAALWLGGRLFGSRGLDTQLSSVSLLLAVVALLPGAWTFLVDRREGDRSTPLPEVADLLAHRMKQRWDAMADFHGLNDASALSVSWHGEDSGLTDDLPSLHAMASSWSPTVRPVGTVGGSTAVDISGEGADLGSVLTELIPTKRMVILGPSGSGKTVLIGRLMQYLLEVRQAGGAVPVRFPMNTWEIGTVDFQTWMTDRIVEEEPTLVHRAPVLCGDHTRAEALVEWDLIIPVLDSFDELEPAARAAALEEINSVVKQGQIIVMASRFDEYRATVTGGSGQQALGLHGAAGVVVQAVTAERATEYLRQARGPWDELCPALETETPAGRALRTPLTLFLCRTIYAEHAQSGRSPRELLDQQRFPDEADIRTHLFAAFIPAVYRTTRLGTSRYSPEQAERTLRFLARHSLYTDHGSGSVQLSWWRMHHLSAQQRRRVSWTLSALVAVLALLLCGSANLGAAILVALFIGGAAKLHLFTAPMTRFPGAGLSWRPRWLVTAVGGAAGIAMVDTQSPPGRYHPASSTYIAAAIGGALVGLIAFGWRTREADRSRPVTPRSLLVQDRRSFLIVTFTWALAFTVVLALLLTVALTRGDSVPDYVGFSDLLMPALIVLTPTFGIGLVFGAGMASRQTAWGAFIVARVLHAVFRRTPIRLLSFMEEAHTRGQG